MEFALVYITTKNKAEALKIGCALIKDRLAACVNIIESMTSIYNWEGKIHQDNETILIAKTRQSLVKKLIKRVKELHSYECPCIVAVPIIEGNKDFLQWLKINSKNQT